MFHVCLFLYELHQTKQFVYFESSMISYLHKHKLQIVSKNDKISNFAVQDFMSYLSKKLNISNIRRSTEIHITCLTCWSCSIFGGWKIKHKIPILKLFIFYEALLLNPVGIKISDIGILTFL